MKNVTHKCPECGRAIEAPAQSNVRWLICPQCNTGFNAPGSRASFTTALAWLLMALGWALWVYFRLNDDMPQDVRVTALIFGAALVAFAVLYLLFGNLAWLLSRGGEVLLVVGLAAVLFFVMTYHFHWLVASCAVAVVGAVLSLRK
jgi:hypothetical protein